MIFNILIILIPAIIPFTILGDTLSNWITILIGLSYLAKYKAKEVNKKFILISLLLGIWALVTIFVKGIRIDQIAYMSSYIIIPLYYLVFNAMRTNFKSDQIKQSINITLISSAIVAVLYIAYIGIYYDSRIYGNLGYANSYAILLLILVNINNKYNDNKMYRVIDIIYFTGVLFTGSRTTLVLLMINIIYLQLKKNKSFLLEGFITAIIIYISLDTIPIIGIISLPLVIYLFYELKEINNKKLIFIGLLLIFIGLIFIKNTNTFERLGNISIKNGSFQERLLTFEDVISNINIFGYGINSFEYNQFKIQTGFYDIKYIHNSLLQTGYELGIIGCIIIISIIIYTIYSLILKKDYENLFVFFIVFIHSLLDFDFTYSSIMILLLLFIIDKESKEKIIIKYPLKLKFIIGIFFVISSCIVFNESLIRISYKLMVQERYDLVKIVTNINPFNDWRIYNLKSDSFIKDTFIKADLDKAKEALLEALKINDENIILKWNLTYIYEKLGIPEAKELKLELVEEEKYNFESYKEAYRYVDLDDKIYDKLLEIYTNAYNNRSFRTKYLKNQLKDSLEDTINMSREE